MSKGLLFLDIYPVIMRMAAPLEHVRLKSLRRKIWTLNVGPSKFEDIKLIRSYIPIPFFGLSLKVRLFFDVPTRLRMFGFYGYEKMCKFVIDEKMCKFHLPERSHMFSDLVHGAIFSGNFRIFHMMGGAWMSWHWEWLETAICGEQIHMIQFFARGISDRRDKEYFLRYAEDQGFQEGSEVYECLDKNIHT